MRFDHVGAQLAQRPATIGLSDLARRLICHLHNLSFLAGRDPHSSASRLQLLHGPDPSRRKGVQVRVDRIDMHPLCVRDLPWIHARAVQQQRFRSPLLVAVLRASHLVGQAPDFGRCGPAHFQWTRHGCTS
jgi:hypothetical protein